MSEESVQNTIESALEEALAALEKAEDTQALIAIKNQYLSKKGLFSQLLQSLAKASSQDKPLMGKWINQARDSLQTALNAKQTQLAQAALAEKMARETIDISLSGRARFAGSLHPVTLARLRIERWFAALGFSVREGVEIEDDFHNFTALNIPKHHPARAMQDTFYFDANTLLRTHTSNVQIRTMKAEAPPLRFIAPGRVYRSDSDMTHTPMFHQVEGLVVDKSCHFADLKGIIIHFLRDFFEREDLQVRFRPSFFPFTEPSAEVDIAFSDGGSDTQLRWLEVLGCGMVHPQVLRNVGINPDEYQGYAFGMGIERLAMLRYGVQDLRQFFENDVRFLRQFGEEA